MGVVAQRENHILDFMVPKLEMDKKNKNKFGSISYGLMWDIDTGGIKLVTSENTEISSPIKPVFYEELDLFGFDKYWEYPKCKEPLLWRVGRAYFYNGEKVGRIVGGGFYESPKLEIFKPNLVIEPIDLKGMIEKNRYIMENIIHWTLDFIYKTYLDYADKVDEVLVGFSGGKDSIVLLDLIQRILLPNEFLVMFNDTKMELSSTYDYLKVIKKKYANLKFITAKSDKDPIELWEKIGIPSRIHRWCCTVFKTAPTIESIEKFLKKKGAKILFYDGLRADESPSRSRLPYTSKGKHLNQINTHPILFWNSSMIYLYIFMRNLPLNELYRYGASRVGCAICPFESELWEFIVWSKYRKEIENYLKLIEEYAKKKRILPNEIPKFIRQGDWKVRIGGRDIQSKDKVALISEESGSSKIIIENPETDFLEWIKVLGDVLIGKNKISLKINRKIYEFDYRANINKFEITSKTKLDNQIIRLLKLTASKAAYCLKCGACEIECPIGALSFNEGRLRVNEGECIHCYRCLSFVGRGCLVADSRKVSVEVKSMKGFGKYKHFGIRKEWLEEYLSDPKRWWNDNVLGPIQFEAMRQWLIDAEIININKNKEHSLSNIGEILQKIGPDNDFTWAVVWTNLSKNSNLVSWYISELKWGEMYSKEELIILMGDKLSRATKNNGILSLAETFERSPLGKKFKIGLVHRKGRAIQGIEKVGYINEDKVDLEPLIILYSLYRLSEENNRYHWGLSHLYSENLSGGPFKLFGINKRALRSILAGLKEIYGINWIGVEFSADLENISLNEKKTSIDVLKLYCKNH